MGDRRQRSRSRDTPDRSGTTTASGPIDYFTDVDDLLREMIGELDELTTAINQRPPLERTDPAETGTGSAGRVDPDAPPIYPYDFSGVVPGDTTAAEPLTATFSAPKDGRVPRVILGWPLGTQQAAGIGLIGPDGQSLIPRGPRDANFVAFDDETISYALNVNMEDNDEIEVRLVNNDSQAHFLNVEIFFQEVSE